MSTKALATALYTYSQIASDFKTAVSDRVYMTRAPQGTEAVPLVYPFVVYFFVTHGVDHYFGAPSSSNLQLEGITLQFNIYSNSNSTSEVLDIGTKLITRFDFASITPSGYKLTQFKRTNIIGPFWVEEIQGFVYSIEYEIIMQKS